MERLQFLVREDAKEAGGAVEAAAIMPPKDVGKGGLRGGWLKLRDQAQRMKETSLDDMAKTGEKMGFVKGLKLDASGDDEHEEETIFEGERPGSSSARASTSLSAIASTKVLRGVPTRLQVWFARTLKEVRFTGPDLTIVEDGPIPPDNNRFMIIDEGYAEVVVAGENGICETVGIVGRGNIIGSLGALGISNTQMFSFRRSHPPIPKGRASSKLAKGEPKGLPADLVVWVVTAQEIAVAKGAFETEFGLLKQRVVQDLRHFLLTYIARAALGGFFRRYSKDLVTHLAHCADLRICQPSELIFKQGSVATSMGMLLSGAIDVFLSDRVITTKTSGTCFGEGALLEDSFKRNATVRCSTTTPSLICIFPREVFIKSFSHFPEQQKHLTDQTKVRVTLMFMHEVFKKCDRNFIALVSMSGHSTTLKWGQRFCIEGEGEEALHVCQAGYSVVQQEGHPIEKLQKGDGIGFEAVVGLRKGAPDYTMLAGHTGCTLMRIPYSAMENALMWFPEQLENLLDVVGMDEAPEDHPFYEGGKDQVAHKYAVALLCKMFSVESIQEDVLEMILSLMTRETYEPGVTVTMEHERANSTVLLLCGTVTVEREGKPSFDMTALNSFDEGVVLGIQSVRAYTLIAQTVLVAWHLPARFQREVQSLTGYRYIQRMVDAAATKRNNYGETIQAILRNRKTFRKFPSELLEMISEDTEIKTFLPEEDIMIQGEAHQHIFIVVEGTVEVREKSKAPVVRGEGSVFGESVVFQMSNDTSVRAISLVMCVLVHKSGLAWAFSQIPQEDLEFVGPAKKAGGGSQQTRLRGRRIPRSAPQVLGHEEEDTNTEEEALGVPKELEQRFQQRSHLFDVPAPQLPAAERGLYCTPKSAEDRVNAAFTRVMPDTAASHAARRHGVLSSTRPPSHQSSIMNTKSVGSDASSDGVHSHVSRCRLDTGRRHRVNPTYTSPLPPLVPFMGAKGGHVTAGDMLRPKSCDQGMSIAGDLQAFACAFARVGAKNGLGEAPFLKDGPPGGNNGPSYGLPSQQRVRHVEKLPQAPPVKRSRPGAGRPPCLRLRAERLMKSYLPPSEVRMLQVEHLEESTALPSSASSATNAGPVFEHIGGMGLFDDAGVNPRAGPRSIDDEAENAADEEGDDAFPEATDDVFPEALPIADVPVPRPSAEDGGVSTFGGSGKRRTMVVRANGSLAEAMNSLNTQAAVQVQASVQVDHPKTKLRPAAQAALGTTIFARGKILTDVRRNANHFSDEAAGKVRNRVEACQGARLAMKHSIRKSPKLFRRAARDLGRALLNDAFQKVAQRPPPQDPCESAPAEAPAMQTQEDSADVEEEDVGATAVDEAVSPLPSAPDTPTPRDVSSEPKGRVPTPPRHYPEDVEETSAVLGATVAYLAVLAVRMQEQFRQRSMSRLGEPAPLYVASAEAQRQEVDNTGDSARVPPPQEDATAIAAAQSEEASEEQEDVAKATMPREESDNGDDGLLGFDAFVRHDADPEGRGDEDAALNVCIRRAALVAAASLVARAACSAGGCAPVAPGAESAAASEPRAAPGDAGAEAKLRASVDDGAPSEDVAQSPDFGVDGSLPGGGGPSAAASPAPDQWDGHRAPLDGSGQDDVLSRCVREAMFRGAAERLLTRRPS